MAFSSLQSCNNQKAIPSLSEEPEIITTVKLEFKDLVNGDISSYFYREMNGKTVSPSQQDTVKLKANCNYFANLSFLNESDSDAIKNITYEIKMEDKSHMVCWVANFNSMVIRMDSDGNFPLGLESKWLNGPASQGNVIISLMHQPNIKNGACEIGGTDIKVSFPVVIR